MTSPRTETAGSSELSLVITQLMKGVLYRDTHEAHWHQLLALQGQVSDYVAVLGLSAEVDEAEGYAFLRSKDDEEEDKRPRLVARRALSFHVSLLLALLRKKLAEFDAVSSEPRLVLSRDQIIEMLRVFMPDSSNDARLVDQVDAHINKVVDLGFLRRLRGDQQQFEVRRIIKAYVDAQWLGEFDERLSNYADQMLRKESD